MSRKLGISPPLIYIVNINAIVTNLRSKYSCLLIVYATIAEENTVTIVPITVRSTEIIVAWNTVASANTYL
ncbi:hypothetical protein D3C80_2145010 [compost metagenome]